MRVRVADLRSLALFALAGAVLVVAGCSEGPGVALDAGDPGPDAGETARDAGSADAHRPDPCDPNPCTEPGRTTCAAPVGVAECRCEPGYEERAGRCERVTTCEPGLCSEHGTCEMGTEGPECSCALGYAGEHCELCDEAAGYYDDGSGRCTLDACSPRW